MIAFFAVACGGAQESTADGSTAAAASESETADASAAADGGGTAAADDTWQATLDAAAEEGRVVFYSHKSDTVNQGLADAFNAEHPEITAEFVRISSGDQTERLNEEFEADSVGADVTINSNSEWWLEKTEEGDWFLDLEAPALEEWDAADYGDGSAIVSADLVVLAYNTDLVTEVPSDYDDLLSDEFADRIGMLEAVSTTGFQVFECQQRIVPDFHASVAELGVVFYDSSVPMAQSVGSGEVAWTTFSYPYLVEDLKEQGAPIEWFVPESGTCVTDARAAVISKASNPNAGQVFMNFLATPEGQAILNENGFSRLDDIPGTVQVEDSQIVPFDFGTWDIEQTREAFRMIYGRG